MLDKHDKEICAICYVLCEERKMKGISLHRRIVSVCIMLVMMLTAFDIPIYANATTVTVTKAGQVVDTMTFNGVTVQAIYIPRNDSNVAGMWDDPTYCCAALVTKFYKAVYGCTVYNLWPGDTPLCDDGYFTKIKTPQVGDIYGNSSHWAIVKEINGNEVVLFEQNWTWYDSNGCYAKYNRTVKLNKLDSDVSFFRYSKAYIKASKPVLTTKYASLQNTEKTFSWTNSTNTAYSTLNIFEYNADGKYNSSNLVSSTPDLKGSSLTLTLPEGHYVAQIINYSSSNEITKSNLREFYIVSEPLATNVTLNKSSITVMTGSTKTIKSTMLPKDTNDILTWTSSDNSIATVSNNGAVTGKSVGVVTITARSVSGLPDTCTVKVKPATVTNLRVSSCNKSSITLSWEKLSKVTGYKVYKYDSSKKKYVKIATVASNSYKLSGLKKASSYKFKVRAYKKTDTKTYVGNYSSVLKAYTRPDKPTHLKARLKSRSTVNLSWTSVYGANSYEIYAQADSGKLTKLKTVSGNKCSASIGKLKRGTTYAFKVKAVKKISGKDISSYSSNAAYVTTTPGKVKGVIAVKDASNNVTLSWKPVNGAAKYQIYMLSGKIYVRVKTVSSPKFKAMIKNLSSSGKHTFKIRAYKESGGYTLYGKYSDAVKA